jgi:hypothetical protein
MPTLRDDAIRNKNENDSPSMKYKKNIDENTNCETAAPAPSPTTTTTRNDIRCAMRHQPSPTSMSFVVSDDARCDVRGKREPAIGPPLCAVFAFGQLSVPTATYRSMKNDGAIVSMNRYGHAVVE